MEALSVLDAQCVSCDNIRLFLETLVIEAEDSTLLSAAVDVQKAFESDYDRIAETITTICGEVVSGSASALKYSYVVGSSNPLVWAIDMGISLGDMVFHTGDIDEKAIGTIAMGFAADYISTSLNYCSRDDGKYKSLSKEGHSLTEILCQLRIIGENKYYETSEARFIKLNAKDIKEYVIDTIDTLKRMVDDYSLAAKVAYKGAKIK